MAILYGGAGVQARDLIWDANADTAPLGEDGGGSWDETSLNWVDGDLVTGTNVDWDSTIPDSATFGNATSEFVAPNTPNVVSFAAPLTVQNLNIGTGTNGQYYNFTDFAGGSLTLAGDINKITGFGAPQILSFGTAINLTAGDHVFRIRDTGGDANPEFTVNGAIDGAGNVIINNDTYDTWGTTAFNNDNSYTGTTDIVKGRLVINASNALGATSTGTTISNLGTLSIGGAGTNPPAGLTINEPITITRGAYDQAESNYDYALLTANGSGTTTLAGPLVIDSADARIGAATSTLVLPGGTISLGANGANGVLSFVGDYAGTVELQGSNPALATNGIKLVSAVEVKVASHDALGGATAPITFGNNGNGDATLHIVGGFMTDFGTHVVNFPTFSGGLNIPAGQVFNITQDLGTAGSNQGTLGKRGEGTLNLSGTNNLTGGQTFFDAGIVNITGSTTLDNLHLRSPTVNISTGGVVTLVEGFSSFGQDSTGTNGGPDKAIVNITGTGQLISQPNVDFNLSDNANTEGTINLQDNGTLSVGGLMHVAKSVGGKGTINQSGGQFTLTRDGNFTLVLGSRDGTGTYNLSGGTMASEGEFYVGQGRNNLTATGSGTFNMTGGTVNLDHWFVIGREGGHGTVDISGGVFNKTRGGTHTEVDVFGGLGPASTMTLRNDAQYLAHAGDVRVGVGNHGTAGPGNGTLNVQDTAQLIISGGELWVGQGGATGVMNIEDSATVTVNNWFAIGREGGNGTVNLSGGTLTKGGSSGSRIVIAAPVNSSAAVGTLNQTGGTLTNTVSETWINENATSGTWNFSAGTANLAALHVGQAGSNTATATLNLSGTAALNASTVRLNQNGAIISTVNLNGGTLTTGSIVGGGGSGTKTLNLNGGTIRASGNSPAFIQNLTANIQDGGAVIDSNSFDVTVPQALSGGSSTGGLTKQGAGTVSLSAAANVYNGPTNVAAGTLAVADTGSANNVLKGGALTIAGGARLDLKNNKLITTSPAGTATGGVYNGVSGDVQRAHNGGAWDQPGLTTSLPDAVSGLTSIGVGTGAQILALGAGQTDTFAGQTVTDTSTIAMYTYRGDANMDGFISGDDYSAIDFASVTPGASGWVNGDFNWDGIISGDDYSAIDFNLVAQGSPFPTSGSAAAVAGVTAVPEPASIALLGLGVFGLGRRRRRTVN